MEFTNFSRNDAVEEAYHKLILFFFVVVPVFKPGNLSEK